MSALIHPTAVIDPSAELADDVRVGPFAVIGPRVAIGAGCEVGAGAQVHGPSRLGAGNRLFPYACVGFEPQDLTYRGEEVFLEVGDRNQFREFTTINRGTAKGGGVTRIGDDNLFLTYSHVGHDAQVGSRTVFINNATLAGHVEVGDDVTIGAFSAVHQFCRVGHHAYIGGYTVVTMDALPYVKTVGYKATCYGLNVIGLRRKGIGRDAVRALKEAMRLLLHSGLNTSQAVERMRAELAGEPAVEYLIDFVTASRRGFIKRLPGHRAGRGAATADAADDADADGNDGESGEEGA